MKRQPDREPGEFYESSEPTDFVETIQKQVNLIQIALTTCTTQSDIMGTRQAVNTLEDLLDQDLSDGYYEKRNKNPYNRNTRNYWAYKFRLLLREMQRLNLRIQRVVRE